MLLNAKEKFACELIYFAKSQVLFCKITGSKKRQRLDFFPFAWFCTAFFVSCSIVKVGVLVNNQSQQIKL